MSKLILVSALALLAAVSAEPYLYSAPFIASPYASSAYIGPASAPLVAAPAYSTLPGPALQALTAPAVSAVSAAVPAVSAAVPAISAAVPAISAPLPYSSVSAYSYGSTYSIQDYLPTVVNPGATSLAYSLPYAYAADYYYRR